jgi:serine/threonine protein phosphatase PrpC
MEDTFQIMHFNLDQKPGTFYGVFDGHGGKDVSYECVHETRGLFPFLIEKIRQTKGRNLPEVMKAAFLEYDRKLLERRKNAGSTAVVVLLYDRKLHLINLGDSRGMIFTKTECLAVSDDHKPQKPKERTRIYKAGHFVNPFRIFDSRPAGKRFTLGDVFVDRSNNKYYIYLNNGRTAKWEEISREQYDQVREMTRDALEDTARVSNSLALSRAFGDFYLKKDHDDRYMGPNAAVSPIPDVQTVNLNQAKLRGQEIYIFLASDGFWDVNRNTVGLRKTMANHPAPQKFCQELVDLSYEKGSQDNTTVLLDKIKV